MPNTVAVLTQREALEVSNQDTVPLLLILEPWAEFFLVPAGKAVVVLAFAPGDGQLEIDDGDNRLTVWGWTGSSVHVLQDGQELEPVVLSSAAVAEISCQRTRPPIVRRRPRPS